MMHPYEDRSMKFSDFNSMIDAVLSGNLKREEVSEKIDGQNLFASMIDGKIRFARNKGNIKNRGAASMSINDMREKWKDIPSVRDAFVESAKELEKSFNQISKEDLNAIFDNGRNWINIEVVWAGNKNVIDYDGSSIVIHNLNIIEDDGSNAGVPAKLQSKLFKIVDNLKPGKITVKTPIMMTVNKDNDFSKKSAHFKKQVTTFRGKQKLGTSATLGDWLDKFWTKKIAVLEKKYNHNLKPAIRKKLVKRLSEFDKSYKLTQIKKDIEFMPLYNDYKDMDKNVAKISKEATMPLEMTFLNLGVEVLKNVETFLSANPDKTVQSLRKATAAKINQIKSSKNMEDLSKMKEILKKIEGMGGFKGIVPTEGIVFKYNGKLYKFTGIFAPLNQMMGLGKYNR